MGSKFSVLMSIYSKEQPEYLEACLQSLVAQTLKLDEMILVEDGPISSELKAVIERYRGVLKITSVPLSENVGLAKALNEGLKYCMYDLVVRMDSDDIALTERFEKQVEFMLERSEISASSSFIEEFNEYGNTFSKRVLPLDHEDIVKFAKKRSPLSHPAVAFRKQAVMSVGGYPELYPEDYLLWIKLIQNGYKLANLSEVLVKMRTGTGFIKRRGLSFLKGEIKIYKYMYDSRFINIFEYCKIILIKSFLRLSPGFIKLLLYKVAR